MTMWKTVKTDALVIGGGIIGGCTALSLIARGIPTTLVTTDGMRGGASWGNAGHIAVEQVEPLANLAMVASVPRRLFWRGGPLSLPPLEIARWLPFSLRLLAAARPAQAARGRVALEGALAQALPAWHRLLARLAAPHLLVEDGHYVVWESERSARRGLAAWRHAPTGTAQVRTATDAEIAAIQRLVAAPIAGAARFSGSGQITDLDALSDAMERVFVLLGGTLRRDTVTRLDRTGDGAATAILSNGTPLEAAAIVVTAGAASAELLGPFGVRTPLIAERGYHIQARGEDWPETTPPIVFEDRAMIVTRFRNGLRAASFTEFARRTAAPDPRKWRRLRRNAAALGLPFGGPVSEWMGARPTLPDYLPAIGRSPAANNLFYAFGHQHLGLTLGPVTGEAIAALIAGETPALDLAPFDLGRFGGVR